MIFRYYQITETFSPNNIVSCPIFSLFSTGSMVLIVQLLFLLQNFWLAPDDRELISKNYIGELCDPLAYYSRQRIQLCLAFVIAIMLKLYNFYCQVYLQIHIEARRQKC